MKRLKYFTWSREDNNKKQDLCWTNLLWVVSKPVPYSEVIQRFNLFFFLNQILRSAPIDRYRLTWMVPALSPCENVGMCFNFIFIIWYAKILPNYSNSRWNRIICQSMLNRCYLFSTKNFVIICQYMCLCVLFLMRYNFSINVLIIWYTCNKILIIFTMILW